MNTLRNTDTISTKQALSWNLLGKGRSGLEEDSSRMDKWKQFWNTTEGRGRWKGVVGSPCSKRGDRHNGNKIRSYYK